MTVIDVGLSTARDGMVSPVAIDSAVVPSMGSLFKQAYTVHTSI